ncbi:nucleoside-diphosphate kinase [Candidatus Peregrinibacteria bacterium]|nr:nucleoside-diphosphate kinase [Candidatus Peregrinibacteria bacterium]
MQRTLIILKPDCLHAHLCGKVIARFEQEGFEIIGCKMEVLPIDTLRLHYAHIADKPFYPDVEKFMRSSPVIILALKGDDIVNRTRDILGVTDCTLAAPGTLRAEYGSKDPKTCKMMNIAHASDSLETAELEIKRFFSGEELFE